MNAVSEWLERHRDELRYEGSENGCDVYTFVGESLTSVLNLSQASKEAEDETQQVPSPLGSLPR
jgi:hypothetical protein